MDSRVRCARASIEKLANDPNVTSVDLDLPGTAHLAQSLPSRRATSRPIFSRPAHKPQIDARNGVMIPRIDLLAAVQSLLNAHARRRVAKH